jgi:hypothetical protein
MGMNVRVLCAAFVAALLLAAPASAAKRSVPQGFYGVQWDRDVAAASPEVQDAQWGRMAASGVEAVRTVFSWDQAQPAPGTPPSFAKTDPVVALAASHGIKLLPIVIYAPEWARKHPSLFNSPPASAADYAAYLTALIGRYGPEGSFWAEHSDLPKRPLREWQIWNEPQLRYQWNDSEYLAGYSDLLKASHKAVHDADPRAKVVLAGFTNFSWEVLEDFYSKGGIKGFFDVAALHPYTASASRVLKIAKLYRAVMKKHGDSRRALWITEMGFPASKGRTPSDSPLQTTEKKAASELTRAYSLLARNRRNRAVAVTRAYWYTWASGYSGSEDIFNYAGLFAFDGTNFARKPQYTSYLASARRHEGCRKNTEGGCRR